MIEIPLSQGKVALIDDEDRAIIEDHIWHAACPRKGVRTEDIYYAATNIKKPDGKKTILRMHRLLIDSPPGMEIDHINGDGLDNRRENLRVCTPSQNQGSRRLQSGCASEFKGVVRNKKAKKWQVGLQFQLDGIKHYRYLGCFENEIDAATAYDKAARKHYGDYALLNFPEEEPNGTN